MTTQGTTHRTLVVAHLAGACVALVTLVTFWSATIFSELALGASGVAHVKRGIALGLCVLVPAIAATGATGARLGGDRRGALIDKKRRRMRFIALNGVVVLAPAAILLSWLSRDAVLGPSFYALQGLELVAGAINVSLLAMNFRDGLRMSRSRRRASLALAERGNPTAALVVKRRWTGPPLDERVERGAVVGGKWKREHSRR